MTVNPGRVSILGAGPAGLYCGILLKKANPELEVTILERNPPDVTYGWGVVFSDRTLASFQRADYKTYSQITEQFVMWDAIDVHYRGETISCGGHVIAAIERRRLLNILQGRCAELGVDLRFGVEIGGLNEISESSLVIAADGVNSVIRRAHEDLFRPSIEMGKSKYIWLGANHVLDAFNFIFCETEYGLFQVHAYPFSGTTSTFIVECEEAAWQRAGLDEANEAGSLAFCQALLEPHLAGAQLMSNNSKWISFPTLKTRNWHADIEGRKVVLLGDAVHTAHFSIGAGTKLAMEDAIALAGAMEQHGITEAALNAYELERKPVVETFQRAAQESRTYFETLTRYLGLPPMQFAFQLLTRSGRITYDDLHFRDPRFGDSVDRWNAAHSEYTGITQRAGAEVGAQALLVAPPPLFSSFRLRDVVLPNRAVSETLMPVVGQSAGVGGVGLVMTGVCAVSAHARITPEDSGCYSDEHRAAWSRAVDQIHNQTNAKVGIQLGHAGRRGATRPRQQGLDRPLREGAWPLLSASALPYTAFSQMPVAINRAGMDSLLADFVSATVLANDAGFDLLQLHFAQGYLVASFLSPLTNRREDDYGGSLQNRARFPLELFDAVRAAWPAGKPMSVALTATDYARGGATIEDAIAVAGMLKEHGCDLISVLAGQTTPNSEPPFGKGFLTPLSDRIRNEAHIPTVVGGYLTNSNDVNTILAAGKADLCIITHE